MASSKKEEACTHDLPYGHFGAAEYDCNEKHWIFQRIAIQQYVLKPLGEAELIVPPPLTIFSDEAASDNNEPPARRRAKQINDLIKTFPELQPASELLPGLLQISEAAESAGTAHEPLQGRLLGYGPIFSESAHVRIAHILAYPHGPSGSDLKLQIVPKYRYGWPGESDHDIDIPHFDGDIAVWKGPGSAIQQIRLARPQEDGRALLAVRYLSCTKIFRPILRARPLHPGSTSRLDPSLVADVGVHQTGGSSHVDVAFNPYFTRQFALVDQDGAWSVWELPWRHGQLKCVSKGTTLIPEEQPQSAVRDQWARIDWLLNPETLMIVSRHRTRLIDLGDANTRLKRTVNHESGVLDASILPSKPTLLAVLTCSHLEVWDLELQKGEEPLLKYRHFRNAEDPSLRMSLFTERQELVVLLQSQLTPAIQILRIEPDGLGLLSILSDPGELSVQPLMFKDDRQRIRDMQLLRLEHTDSEDADTSTNMRFYSCIAMSRSLAVSHLLLYAHANGDDGPSVKQPQRKSKARPTRLPSRKGFVIDDDEDLDSGRIGTLDEGGSRVAPAALKRALIRSDPSWTMDYRFNARRLQTANRSSQLSFEDVMTNARNILDIRELSSITTLADSLQDEILVPDVDQCTSELEEFAFYATDSQTTTLPSTSETGNFRTTLRPLTFQFAGDMHLFQQSVTFSEIYRHMIVDWISPLDEQIQSGTRLGKEQAIRKVALQLALASQVVKREHFAEPDPEVKDAEFPSSPPLLGSSQSGSQWDLPLRPWTGVQSPRSQSSTGFPTFPLTPTTTPSMITNSSMQTMSQELNRLSAYTTITRNTPVIGSRAVGSVLSHWQIGEDPDSYDWTSSNHRAARLAEQEEFENADLTEKERARVRRHAERHLRRQRREAAASQAARLQSSQVPTLLNAGQPQVPARRIKAEFQSQQSDAYATASSQTQGDSQGRYNTASQVQPGRFGGRPMADSVKKRKRKSGF